jgi:hypothetical protein
MRELRQRPAAVARSRVCASRDDRPPVALDVAVCNAAKWRTEFADRERAAGRLTSGARGRRIAAEHSR